LTSGVENRTLTIDSGSPIRTYILQAYRDIRKDRPEAHSHDSGHDDHQYHENGGLRITDHGADY
jgi:hypothetical protein